MTSSAGRDPQSSRMLILLIAMASGMMAVSGILVFLLVASQADPEVPQRAPMVAPADPSPEREVPVQGPAPSALGGGEAAGYGRPEPLFGADGAPTGGLGPVPGNEPPLYIDPDDDQGSTRPYAPTDAGPAEVRGLGGAPDTGSLPGRWGNPYAPLRLVVFNDFECPFCSRLEATFEQLHERYGDRIEVWFRDYPLAMHQHARGAHMAARCAHDQGRFWAMHDLLFANQRALGTEDLLSYAAQLGLDGAAFERCLLQEHHAVEIDRDIAAAKATGVTGTPATFVNGTLVSGAQPVDAFIEIIEAAGY
jgi:predicted DsbA family dithiol-disulfide isomerase